MARDLIWSYQREALFFGEIFKKRDAKPLDMTRECVSLVCWHHSISMKGEEVKGEGRAAWH